MKQDIFAAVVAVLAVLATVQATVVQDCKTGKDYQDTELVKISDCEKPACRLRRKNTVAVEAKFKTSSDIKTLRNTVSAKILGIPFPFIGVDGTSACTNIYTEEGTMAGCPLEANTTYLYKNSFAVLEIYPKLRTVVRWALTDPSNNSQALCFDVKVRITS